VEGTSEGSQDTFWVVALLMMMVVMLPVHISFEGISKYDYEFSINRRGQRYFLALLNQSFTRFPPHPPTPSPQWTEMTAGRKWGGIFLEEAGSSES
jgi:hypothetical protein